MGRPQGGHGPWDMQFRPEPGFFHFSPKMVSRDRRGAAPQGWRGDGKGKPRHCTSKWKDMWTLLEGGCSDVTNQEVTGKSLM